LFVSEEQVGNIDNPIMMNVIVIFELDKGEHNLFLRAISVGNNASIDLTNTNLECLSYRNFMDLAEEEAHK
jgi:hypothetical protein